MMVSTDLRYFQDLYAASDDPWNFSTSPYERRKYSMTVGILNEARYQNAFEPGCSIGILSELLADRCDRLLVTDIISSALTQASKRLKRFAHVEVEERAIPEWWPSGTFDLIVLSEIAYYFDLETLCEVMSNVVHSTEPGAHVVGVHWRGVTDYPLSGDDVHEVINADIKLRRIVHHVESEFVLDLWERLG
jgi:trans-aconitate methyltransferase